MNIMYILDSLIYTTYGNRTPFVREVYSKFQLKKISLSNPVLAYIMKGIFRIKYWFIIDILSSGYYTKNSVFSALEINTKL